MNDPSAAPDRPEVVFDIRMLLDDQEASTQVARKILQRAADLIESLSFPLGYSCQGHDQVTVVSLLREMIPGIETDQWKARARELATTP